MPEFKDRINAQREVLEIVNRQPANEELFGLSSKAIERWISVNHLDPNSDLVRLIRTISGRLFFLANKSQEQITEEYQGVASEIASLTARIKASLQTL